MPELPDFLFGWTQIHLHPQKITMFFFYVSLTFEITVIADDYDRSINEAIKVTKYALISFLSLSCICGEGDGLVIFIRLFRVLMAYVSVSSIFRQKQPSPECMPRRESVAKAEALSNGKYGPPHATQDRNFGIPSPESSDSDDDKEDNETDNLDRRFAVFVSFRYVQVFSSKFSLISSF